MCEVVGITRRRTGSLPFKVLFSYFVVVRGIIFIRRMTPGEGTLTDVFFVGRLGCRTVSFLNAKIGLLLKM